MRRLTSSVLCLLSFWLLSAPPAPAAVVITNGSSWKYLLGTAEASTPRSLWRLTNFNDSAWNEGPMPTGYAVPANDAGGYEATIRTTLPTTALANYVSVFFRKPIVLTNSADIAQVRFSIVVDDGYIIWINGTEMGRYNAPAGDAAFNALPPGSIEATLTSIINSSPGSFLVDGTNMVAIQVFNGSTNSSDLFIDLSVTAIPNDFVPPTIANVSPPAGPANNLSHITVTFSEPVTGVDASDLLINGQPAASITTNSSSSYVFSFVQPAFGTVQISWSASHGIKDQSLTPNAFNATGPGATWQYDLQDRVPPSVAGLTPQAGFTVRSLSQVEVRFSEDVTGVDAADFRVNGNAASGLLTLSPSRYLFTFTQPPTGSVQVTWAPSHGIKDLALPPNAFAGFGWSYVLNPNAPAAEVIITEFLAGNSKWQGAGPPPANKISDEDGDYSDWIEIFNAGTEDVNLLGWHLTDTAGTLNKWTFPETNFVARTYMIIFASQKDRAIPGRPLHTNFKLSSSGEYLALVKPDGTTITTAFAPVFPPQVDDVSFGFPTLATPTSLISTNTPITALVPVDGTLGLDWTVQTFNDSAWIHGTNGVGFETATNPPPSLRSFILTDVASQMFGQNASMLVRIPFVVDDVSQLDALTLRLRYDDGFVAYLNGEEVLRINGPAGTPIGEALPWNASATATRLNDVSAVAEEFDFTPVVRNGGLQTGTNILAIQGLNSAADDGDFLLSAELIGQHREIQLTQTRYFTSPTPGSDNGAGTEGLGPIISEVVPTPQLPGDNDDIVVTARITTTFAPVGQVTLTYRVMFGPDITLPMVDDGQHGDGAANDGIYGATIPASGLSVPGQMIRWYVRSTDTQGRSLRLPSFLDPIDSPQYFGTMVSLAQTNPLPVLHWFVQNPAAAATIGGTRASVSYLGEFYDNIFANIHGQSSQGFPQHSYNLDFTRGNDFNVDPSLERRTKIDLLTIYADKTHIRNMLAYATWRDAGAPYHFVIPVRVQINGAFAGDWDFVEKGDETFLKRLGKDPNGALYKMYSTFTDPVLDVQIRPNGAEKKTRKQEGNADLVDLMNGMRLTGTAKNNYVYDNFNIPEMIDFLAAHIIDSDTDCCHKNYYFYRDSDGTGEWEGFPWDVDLSFGHVWNSVDNYWDHRLHPDNGIDIGNNNPVFAYLINGTPQNRSMYLRRVRTLMDEMLGPPNAPVNHFEAQIDYWLPLIAPDAAIDDVVWPNASTWGNGLGAGSPTSTCCTQSMPQAVAELRNSYLSDRRVFLYNAIGGSFPPAQPSNVVVQIQSVEYSPTNGNQAQEYIELFNPNTFAVDISGWKISGAIDFTFKGGTVIPPTTSLYVSPDVKAWRARTTGPGGGQGLFVVGNYQGQLSARGETIFLTDKSGAPVTSLAYPGSPSPAQQYLRITELMYHPLPLAGNTNDAEAFEYIELKNTGPQTIDLTGVKFGDGVLFDFTASSVTSLAAGQRVLIVKSISAFQARYGTGLLIAGQYSGNLDNSGERLRLLDAVNEEILDFSYNNSWYPITDGVGFSLVIVNDQGEPDSWGHKESWRASGEWFGSPGQTDATPPAFVPVLVNEALTRSTNLPDSVELYNPNTNAVDLSGWYLTDDFSTPNKFRITNGTSIAAGGYLVFNETQFNATPGVGSSFALSADGDELYLFGAQPNGALTGYYHGFSFGAAEEDVSFGRYVSSEGHEHFVAQNALTPGGTNAGPKVGPVVISEIMYHPLDFGGTDNSVDEFIELMNITTNAIPLFDPLSPTNTWHLSGGADFKFPTNVWLVPGATLLVLNIDPGNAELLSDFRQNFGVDPDVQVFGPFGGKLNDDTDSINLKKPTPLITNHLAVPYALVDRVEYHDTPPWPGAADGVGASLQRLNPNGFGDDPANWAAARPSAGAGTSTNGTPPQFTVQPAGHFFFAGQGGVLTATITGSAPLSYQWRLNGANILGANSLSLQLTNIQPQQAGDYELIVLNGLGSAVSDKATVSVRVPVTILQQPLSIDVRIPPDVAAAPSTNATFRVAAFSSAPIRFQWHRNDSDIPGATNSTYTIAGVKTTDFAYYSVYVYDDVSNAQSSNVWLYPLVSPTFTDLPVAQSVVRGGPVTLSVQIIGWPPPFTYEWRAGTTTVVSKKSQDDLASFYSFIATNVTTVGYRVLVSNRALPAGRISGAANISTLVDTDGDGIPDLWETGHGSDPNNAADKFGDPDGDGMLNWQEYQAGTDPTNALSRLAFDSLVWSNGTVRLQYQTVSNKTYAVQYCPSLTTSNWLNLANIVARRTNRVEVTIDPLPTANRFYRLVTPTPP